jgi:hypothetical protein
MQWIVMTSSAHMPNSCWGRYRNVALVLLRDGGLPPKIITDRAKGVAKLIHLGHHHVGKTSRCAYARALTEAETRAAALNANL